MSLTDARIERDLRILLNLIGSQSRFTACRATTEWLAKTLGWPEDQVEARLDRLESRKLIWRKTTPPRWSGSGWTRGRTLYLVSGADPARGALLAANLFRDWGRKVELRRDHACGQLQCLPSQLDQWLGLAQGLKYIAVTRAENGKDYVERIGNFPAVDLPNRYCVDYWSQPAVAATLDEKILALVTARTRASPPRPPTYAEIAAQVGASRSHTNATIKKLVDAEVLFQYQRGGQYYVASDRATAEAEAARPDDDIALALMALRREPMTTRQLALHLGLDVEKPLPASLRRRLRNHGVVMTPFGRRDVASIGPLPRQYRVDREQQQKDRRTDADRLRRWCKKLGLQRGDQYLLADVRVALTNLLFNEWNTRVAYLWLERLRRTAHEFAGSFVSDDVLAQHVRKARAESGGGRLAAEQVAVAVHADVAESFKPHALRVARGYDGPLRHAA
jgi:hypothetical protein